ncbi:FtsK/SpoIIIE domain-containing protein [Nocardia flavorosea]|uniref:FtsK domain-containing protein n=2 Tax=Nocardia flavorosea TaxID=53429 RepID=A0A846YTK6_9NOCA|nr:FtsK/SpoIIIE domain-containing protein [Nocardia flavorosea]NKY60991.1 hypothetical protein [Nocardia flavorosea]
MGNGMNQVSKASSSGGALVVAGVVSVPVVTFGGMVSYFTLENMGVNGWTGPAGLVGAAGTVAGLIVWSKVARNRAERRAIEQAYAARLRWLSQFPERTQYAIDILTDPFQAALMWTHPRVGIGIAPNPNTGFPGTFPTLVPGQDPGHHPDNGIRESHLGARVRLLLPPGPSANDVRLRLDNIAASLRVPKVRLVAADGEVVSLELEVRNPLRTSVRLEAPDASPVNLKAVRVGMRDDGQHHHMAVWSTHIFLAGLTGSGKSGVLWSLIAGVAPDVKAGRVELHVIDLKFGAEMGAGDRLFAAFAWQVPQAIAILENLVRKMEARANPVREHAMRTGEAAREFVPEPGNPQILLIIDEILDLLKISGDLKIKPNISFEGMEAKETTVAKYAARLLLSLLSRARAFGITVLVATQNAAKEVFELLRDMFPMMVGLRQASQQQELMVFGPGASERGVAATDIKSDEQGIAYIDSPEEGGMAIRARFYRVTNEDIKQLVRIFGRPADAPRPVLPSLGLPEDEEQKKTNVVELRRDDQEQGQQQTPPAEAEEHKPGRCRFCGSEIQQTPGGRPALYCPGTDHRARYNRLKRKLAQGE